MFKNFRSKEAAEFQWLHYPNQSNVDNLNNVRREVSRHFREKKGKEYLKLKLMKLKPAVR